MRIALVRQRPSIGDCLLLGPLVQELKLRHPDSKLTVITDPLYMGGALPKIFEHMEGVDRIEHIPMMEWTTRDNKAVDGGLAHVPDDPPCTVQRSDLVLDCNGAFISFEREHNGQPPYGIAEFWLRHFDLYREGMDLLPRYTVDAPRLAEADQWLAENGATGRKRLGIVLRAGDPVRNWDNEGWSGRISDWAHTRGYQPIGIDPFMRLQSQYAIHCISRPLDYVAALLSRCDVVLTPDTGLLHLAQAVGTRTVSLWGIMDPMLRVKGYDSVVVPPRSLGLCPENECRCWKFQRWSCMRKMTLNQVLEGLEVAFA